MKPKLDSKPDGSASDLSSASSSLGHSESAARTKMVRWFRRISKRKLVLGAGDLLVVNTSLFLTEIRRAELEPSWESISKRFYWFVTLSVLWLIIGKFFRIYDLRKAYSVPESLKSTLSVSAITCFLYLLIPVITPTLPPQRLEAVLFLLLMFIGAGLWRFVFARSFIHPGFRRRALIVGAGWAGQTLVQAMANPQANATDFLVDRSHYLLGFIDDDVKIQHTSPGGLPVLGTSDDLVKLARELQPHDLILAVTHRGSINPKLFQAILACREMGISIVRMPDLYERLTNQVPLEHSGNNLDVIIPLELSVSQRLYPVLRDIAEIFTAIPGLALLCLAIPIVWAANRLTSPGPLFYKQQRVGKGGHLFYIVKFRSMVVAAEHDTGIVWAKKNDDRITPIGRFLRKARLDELPQFLNIISGEMSLIGPRPERPDFVDLLEKEMLFYRLRHAVKPGITGWAQVHYGYGASVNDSFIKLKYDFYYIKNQSLFLDLMIIVKTFSVVLGLKGR